MSSAYRILGGGMGTLRKRPRERPRSSWEDNNITFRIAGVEISGSASVVLVRYIELFK